jgi:hypothetical protein
MDREAEIERELVSLQTHRAPRRVMIGKTHVFEITRSLFGRYPWGIEQALIVGFNSDVGHAAIVLIPEEIAPYGEPLIRIMPLHKKQETAFKWLGKAKEKLLEVGI